RRAARHAGADHGLRRGGRAGRRPQAAGPRGPPAADHDVRRRRRPGRARLPEVSLRQSEHLGGRAGQALLAVTERRGRVTRPPYDGATLGAQVGDDPQDVAANRAALAAELDRPAGHLVFMNQVHGDTVAVVDGPRDAPVPDVDALVTTVRGLALVVLVADCVP